MRRALLAGSFLLSACSGRARAPAPASPAPAQPAVAAAAESAETAVIRSAVRAFNSHDVDAVVAHYAPDIRWYGVTADGASVEGDGVEGIRAWLKDYFASTAAVHSDVSDFVQVGPHVGFRERVTWRARDGSPRAQTSLGVYELRAGKIRRAWYYPAERENAALPDVEERTAADKELDATRKPNELVEFCGIRQGMKVADLGAGGGYTTEVLARAVGSSGVVYGINNRFALETIKLEKPWTERLRRRVNANVVNVARELDAPFPPEAKELDAVVFVLLYHDTFWLGVDRRAMNAAVFSALRPGGVYCVVDHSGRPGTGSTEVKSLHRIEEVVVTSEIAATGFRLDGQGSFLRNAADKRDWNPAPFAAGPRRGQSDRFVLRFVKPK